MTEFFQGLLDLVQAIGEILLLLLNPPVVAIAVLIGIWWTIRAARKADQELKEAGFWLALLRMVGKFPLLFILFLSTLGLIYITLWVGYALPRFTLDAFAEVQPLYATLDDGLPPPYPAAGDTQPRTQPRSSQSSCGESYTVQPGDTLTSIGVKCGVDWQEIAQKNGKTSPWTISVGEVLKLP